VALRSGVSRGDLAPPEPSAFPIPRRRHSASTSATAITPSLFRSESNFETAGGVGGTFLRDRSTALHRRATRRLDGGERGGGRAVKHDDRTVIRLMRLRSHTSNRRNRRVAKGNQRRCPTPRRRGGVTMIRRRPTRSPKRVDWGCRQLACWFASSDRQVAGRHPPLASPESRLQKEAVP
jgi:hypothetical protein